MAGGAVQIAILGAGQVGSTLGRLWHAAGHDVTFAARGAARPQALAAELGGRARAASVAGAVAGAKVVLVAVPGPVVNDVLKAKIRATADNAREVLAILDEYGSIRGYLASFPDASAAAADMRRRFKFLGDTGVWRLLTSASHDIG